MDFVKKPLLLLIVLLLKDILIGILTPEGPLLNYLILIGKIYFAAAEGMKYFGT